MRGGSLSDAKVIEALRPYIVTAWSGRCGAEMPASIRAVFDEAGLRTEQNLLCIVLDAQGKYVRSFHPWSGKNLHEMRFDAARMADATLSEIRKTSALLKLPPPAESKLNLPDIERGVRIFIKVDGSRDPLRQYRAPIVEVAPTTARERTALARPEKSREIEASELAGWLRLVYPAAVMDGKGGMEAIEGRLTLAPAGARAATLQGECVLRLDNRARTVLRLRLEAVLRYDEQGDFTLRLVMTGIYPKQKGDGVAEMPMTVAIESRPE